MVEVDRCRLDLQARRVERMSPILRADALTTQRPFVLSFHRGTPSVYTHSCQTSYNFSQLPRPTGRVGSALQRLGVSAQAGSKLWSQSKMEIFIFFLDFISQNYTTVPKRASFRRISSAKRGHGVMHPAYFRRTAGKLLEGAQNFKSPPFD